MGQPDQNPFSLARDWLIRGDMSWFSVLCSRKPILRASICWIGDAEGGELHQDTDFRVTHFGVHELGLA
jgi:hypothetical protein